MSNGSVNAELVIRIKDATPQGAAAVVKSAEAMAQKTSTAIERASKKSADDVERSNKQQRTSYEKLSQAREALGVRSEKTIQKEIENTRRAYGQLASAGFASAQEQERAYAAVQSRITRLTNEMGKLTTAQKKAADEAKRLAQIEADQARGQRVVRGVVAGAVGAGAAAYTLKALAMQAMSFDERVGLLSNTAYAERDKAGRKLGDAQIVAAIKKTIATGMTREASLDALEKLIADDQVGGVGAALELLPFIGKVSTGSGSAGKDVAAMMGSFIGSGYAKDVASAKRLMGISSAAATAGAFEKNDMAKHLPALLPLAKVAGLTGEDGFKRLLVLLQQARTTAGSSDEAANNVKNLLSKLSSNDTATDFKKAGRGDLYKHLIDQRAKGVDPLTAWQNVIDSEIEKNPNLKPAIAKLKKAATKEEQDAAIESIKGMAEGQSIGKYFQDMQAKGALFGLRNKDVEVKVTEALSRSGAILDVDYDSMADRAGVKTRVAKEQADMAAGEAMDRLTPAIGRAAEAFSDLASKHPLLVGTTTLATTALAALAGAAGIAALSMGGKVPGSGAIGRAAGAIAGSPISRYALKVGGIGAVGAVAGDWALGKAFGEESAISRYGSSMLTGAAAGATIGSIVPVLGTGIGALVGGGLGAAWEGIKDLLKPAEQKPLDVNAKLQVGLAPGLVLQSQSMNATDGNVYMNTGNLMNGAP
jgi:hypothetical protein